MKMKFMAVLFSGLLMLGLSSCNYMNKAYEEAAQTSFRVNVPEGTSALGMLKMMEPEIKPNPRLGDTVQYIEEKTQDELYSKLQKGDIEIAAVPTEMAARLYNENSDYKLAAVNTKGFIYVLVNNMEIVSWGGLKGTEVNIANKGSAEDIIFRYLLNKNGLNPDKDISIKYADSQDRLCEAAISGSSKITVLSEPWVSKVIDKNSRNKIALDLHQEWTRINGSGYPMVQTCIVVKKEIADTKSDSLSLFLKDYEDSIDWVNENPNEAAELLDKHPVGVKREYAAATIKRCNIEYINSKDAESAVEKYLLVLYNASPGIIGGKLPGKDFYYIN